MKEHLYIITGVNKLTGLRDQISGAMAKEDAQRRLERELENRRRQKYQTYSRLRIEHLEPAQLTIKFEDT